MIRMTKEQINEVLIAFAEGKAIEYRNPSLPNVWYDCDDEIPIFDFKKYDFRVKEVELFEIKEYISTYEPKSLGYFGAEIQIPLGVFKWIATDEDGTVAVYEGTPTYVEATSGGYWAPGDYEYEILGEATCFKGSAKDSLMEIK